MIIYKKKEKLGDEFSPTEFIIQAGGNSVLKLRAAGVEKKDKIDYSSLCVDISTNEYVFNKNTCPTVQSAIPINRRIAGINNTGFPCIMAVKEQYGMLIEIPDGIVFPTAPDGKPDNYFTLTLDMSKVPLNEKGERDYSDVYEFYDWSFTKGQLLRGGRCYSKAQYLDEFLRRFRIHYNNQINFLQGAARRGEVCTNNLPNFIEVQMKSSFQASCDKTRLSSSLQDMKDLMDDDFETVEDYVSDGDDISHGYMLSHEDEEEEIYPVEEKTQREELGFTKYKIDLVKTELFEESKTDDSQRVVEVMEAFLLEKALHNHLTLGRRDISCDSEYKTQSRTSQLDERGLNCKQARIIFGWTLEEIKTFVKLKFTDPLIKATKKCMSYGMAFGNCIKYLSLSLFDVLVFKMNFFLKDPLLWFKNHPFVSLTLAGVTSLAVFSLVSLSVKMFRCMLGNKKEEKKDEPKFEWPGYLEGKKKFYQKHLLTPGLEHNMDCCSTDAIDAAYRSSLIISEAETSGSGIEKDLMSEC